jgi:hypothetical protein
MEAIQAPRPRQVLERKEVHDDRALEKWRIDAREVTPVILTGRS